MSTTAPPRPRQKDLQYGAGEFKIETKDEGVRTFEGLLSTSHLDLGDGFARDIVYPGAFKRTLANFRSAADPYVPLLDSHNRWSIMDAFGHLLEAEERLTGKVLEYEMESGGTLKVPEMVLWTKWQVIDGADGDRLMDRLRPGSVRKMSMGYVTFQSDEKRLKDIGLVRVLREVGLREGSLVVFPMNWNAETDRATIKSMDDLLATIRAGTLTDQQKAELRALLDAPPQDPGTDPGPGDAPKELAPEARQALALRLRLIKLRGPATRPQPARHAPA